MNGWELPKPGTVYGFDPASLNGDRGVTTVWAKPSRLRKLFRRIGLDKSTWEIKLVEVINHGK